MAKKVDFLQKFEKKKALFYKKRFVLYETRAQSSPGAFFSN